MNDALTKVNQQFKVAFNGQKKAEATIAVMQQREEYLKATQKICVGKADDQIDLALAQFLNSYPDRLKLKILF